MRQIDESNMEEDKFNSLRKEFTNKLVDFTERLNVKISSLESQLKHQQLEKQAQEPAKKPPGTQSYATFYARYALGTVIYYLGQNWTIVEVAFDKQGAIYTLQAADGTFDRKLVAESFLGVTVKI